MNASTTFDVWVSRKFSASPTLFISTPSFLKASLLSSIHCFFSCSDLRLDHSVLSFEYVDRSVEPELAAVSFNDFHSSSAAFDASCAFFSASVDSLVFLVKYNIAAPAPSNAVAKST